VSGALLHILHPNALDLCVVGGERECGGNAHTCASLPKPRWLVVM
jgi:hypothetical protein